jgi:hypothetical protein
MIYFFATQFREFGNWQSDCFENVFSNDNPRRKQKTEVKLFVKIPNFIELRLFCM